MSSIRKLNNISLKFPYFNTSFIPLSQYATILRAPLFKDQPGASGHPFRIISIKDFPEAGYLPEPQREIILQGLAEKANEYAVEPFDLLVTMVGTIGRVTIVPEDCDSNWVPATNMFVIRFNEDASRRARALYALLKSPAGQDIFYTLAHGRGIQIVSKKQFSGLLLPELDDEVLAHTESLWEEENSLYLESLRKLEETRRVYENLDEVRVEAEAI